VLVFTPYFLPSDQGGGSVRAVQHLCEQLGDEFEWVIAAGDRDIDRPLDPTACEALRSRTALDVRYLPYGLALFPRLTALLSEPWDLVYFNSFLSPRFTLLPLLLLRSRHPVLLAPRGELLAGAWSQKSWLKRLYLVSLRLGGLLKRVHWQATSAEEATRLRQFRLGPISMAPDLPPRLPEEPPAPQPLPSGPLQLVYLSRIDRQKNLGFALQALMEVRSPVTLDVYGPVTDLAYWQQCQVLITELPAHVTVQYHGALAPHHVPEALGKHEMLVLPTLGENHGYVIGEALLAGCLVLTSDQTPWTSTSDAHLIRALALDNSKAFASAIDEVAQLDATSRWELRRQAQSLGLNHLKATSAAGATRRLFDQLCRVGG